MTWLVTGGSGFLGVHLLRHLAAAGIPARSIDLAPLHEELPGIDPVIGDIRDARLVRRALDGVDVVVHAAAALPGGGDLESANVAATDTLARLAAEAGVRRSILVSSAVVYGLAAPPVAEIDAPHPIEPYGRSKLRAENVWLRAAAAPLVLRPSAFLGSERLGVFGILFRWIREGRRVYVLGDGSNRYQLLDVADLVELIVRAAERPAVGVVNVGGIVGGTVRQDLEALIRHAGSGSRVVGLPARPARAALGVLGALRLSPLAAWHRRSADRDVVLDCTRAFQWFGWRPTRSSAETLCEAYDWFRDRGAHSATGTTHRARWNERGLALLRKIS